MDDKIAFALFYFYFFYDNVYWNGVNETLREEIKQHWIKWEKTKAEAKIESAEKSEFGCLMDTFQAIASTISIL
jgi:GTP-dependent phosphoenolpyruvate carboxykinase